MKAIQLIRGGEPGNSEALITTELETPEPSGQQLLVAVQAISVNPVDTKVRKGHGEKPARVLGWDASGIVLKVASSASPFKVGDQVYYAGDLTQPGSYQQEQLVDERIVAHKPKSLSTSDAAALPLTALTAWEALFDRLGISEAGKDAGKSLLIVGGGGGVGSIAIQLAKKLAKLQVIASASRPESIQWVKDLGADEVVNHRSPLNEEVRKLGRKSVDYVLCLNSTDHHFDAMVDIVAPQGMICSIVETSQPHNLEPLMSKSAGFVWELMFTRSLHQTSDIARQGEILGKLAALIDEGVITSTANEKLSPINPQTIDKAHQSLVKGNTLGKIVLEGWS